MIASVFFIAFKMHVYRLAFQTQIIFVLSFSGLFSEVICHRQRSFVTKSRVTFKS